MIQVAAGVVTNRKIQRNDAMTQRWPLIFIAALRPCDMAFRVADGVVTNKGI